MFLLCRFAGQVFIFVMNSSVMNLRSSHKAVEILKIAYYIVFIQVYYDNDPCEIDDEKVFKNID